MGNDYTLLHLATQSRTAFVCTLEVGPPIDTFISSFMEDPVLVIDEKTCFSFIADVRFCITSRGNILHHKSMCLEGHLNEYQPINLKGRDVHLLRSCCASVGYNDFPVNVSRYYVSRNVTSVHVYFLQNCLLLPNIAETKDIY